MNTEIAQPTSTSSSSTSYHGPQHHHIRANYDNETIAVYQAYNRDIASAAVENQKLSSSPKFRFARMTWIKPSWCWMMYRSGYSYKDENQERILEIRMKHKHFIGLLEKAIPCSSCTTNSGDSLANSDNVKTVTRKPTQKSDGVRVQWDPERTARLENLEDGSRSIQIGIPGALTKEWVENQIFSIEDVTERAQELKKVLEEKSPEETINEELIKMGLLPEEKSYDHMVPNSVKRIIDMAETLS